MRPQALKFNSYINFISEDTFIQVTQDVHHIVIKTNIVDITIRPHHIHLLGHILCISSQKLDNYYKVMHKEKCTQSHALEHLTRTSLKSHLCNVNLKSHTSTYTMQLPQVFFIQVPYFTSVTYGEHHLDVPTVVVLFRNKTILLA